MFGHACAFLNGHVVCGLHQGGIIVRLPEPRRDALVAKGANLFERKPGQPTKDYVVAPVSIASSS
jgi:hypothetical protein